ncbi:MAG: hypothetical protein WC119_09765 [Synergistaceae bacterium]|jgi:hypothetical protein|nr:hypothetical protein [Candidatus Omnitrophota bacterium]
MDGPVMIQYKNLATGHDVAYEKGSKLEKKAAANSKKFKRLTKPDVAKAEKPEKSG